MSLLAEEFFGEGLELAELEETATAVETLEAETSFTTKAVESRLESALEEIADAEGDTFYDALTGEEDEDIFHDALTGREVETPLIGDKTVSEQLKKWTDLQGDTHTSLEMKELGAESTFESTATTLIEEESDTAKIYSRAVETGTLADTAFIDDKVENCLLFERAKQLQNSYVRAAESSAEKSRIDLKQKAQDFKRGWIKRKSLVRRGEYKTVDENSGPKTIRESQLQNLDPAEWSEEDIHKHPSLFREREAAWRERTYGPPKKIPKGLNRKSFSERAKTVKQIQQEITTDTTRLQKLRQYVNELKWAPTESFKKFNDWLAANSEYRNIVDQAEHYLVNSLETHALLYSLGRSKIENNFEARSNLKRDTKRLTSKYEELKEVKLELAKTLQKVALYKRYGDKRQEQFYRGNYRWLSKRYTELSNEVRTIANRNVREDIVKMIGKKKQTSYKKIFGKRNKNVNVKKRMREVEPKEVNENVEAHKKKQKLKNQYITEAPKRKLLQMLNVDSEDEESEKEKEKEEEQKKLESLRQEVKDVMDKHKQLRGNTK